MTSPRRWFPLLALAVGTWFGLGRPDAAVARRYLHENSGKIAPFAREVLERMGRPPVASTDPPPLLPPPLPPVPLSPSFGALGDLVPWPRLNPNAGLNRAWLLAEGPDPEPNNGERLVTFTFDDGPSTATTPAILRTLAQYGVRATFFLIGRYLDGEEPRAEAAREVARQIAKAGHLVGNHTHDHALLTQVPHIKALRQMDEGAASIEKATGLRPSFFRPPYGRVDQFTQDAIAERSWELVLWSVDAQDMLANDGVAIAASIEGQIERNGGGLVLLHDVKPSTVAALPHILAWLDSHKYDPSHPEAVGYRIVDIAEYLRATAARPQPYPNRAALEEARKDEYIRMRSQALRSGQPVRPLVPRARRTE